MIQAINLTKYYGSKCAVDSVSFEIAKGEIFGLLGPNGAGKTTIVKMLTTLSRPASGGIFISGRDVIKHPEGVRGIIGVVPQERNLDRELTVVENILIYGMLHSIEGLKERIDNILSEFGLMSERNTVVEKLSGGMQRRLLIARAMLTNPRILFMDEPTIGLDPQIRRQIWETVREIRHKGVTIFFTTHYIEEAEMLCDRVGILSKGRLIAVDTPLNLKNRMGKYAVEMRGSNGKMSYIFCSDRNQAVEVSAVSGNSAVIRPINLEDVFIQLVGEAIDK